jgi:hypothetical protein
MSSPRPADAARCLPIRAGAPAPAGSSPTAASVIACIASCDRALVWNAATKKFDYAPVATVRMIQ